MEYQVPQFIEVEDKVVGPLTLKQFIFIAGGVGISVGLFLYLHIIGIIIALPILAFSAALAFYRINNKSFTEIVEAAFNYYVGGRLYLWKKDAPREQAPVAPVTVTREKLGLTRGKLHDLAWSLDIKDGHAPAE
jgi:hypothetical protein